MTKGNNNGRFTSKTAPVAANKRWSEEGVGIVVQPKDIEAQAPKKQEDKGLGERVNIRVNIS
eukprot:COSAG05_NODE_2759_length_2673_cov_2.130925_1_plen_62_part_00